MKSYTTKEVREILGLTKDNMDSLIRLRFGKGKERGFIPEWPGGRGRGNEHAFSESDLELIRRWADACAKLRAVQTEMRELNDRRAKRFKKKPKTK